MKPNFELWTIYEHPADHPRSYVARLWRMKDGEAVPSSVALSGPTLEGVRELLPQGLVCMARNEGDDPCIVETWF